MHRPGWRSPRARRTGRLPSAAAVGERAAFGRANGRRAPAEQSAAGDATVERGAGEYAFGPRDVPHSFTAGHDGPHMSWVITPGGFDAVVEKVRGPAETPMIPPAHVLPPENVAAIALKHDNELL
jgi:hypothetical protein